MLMFLFIGLIAGCVQDRQKALKSGQKSIILSGTVAAIDKVEVLAPVSAIVGQIVVKEGQRVGRGAVVVRLEPSTLAIDVRRTEAVLDLARANLAQAESTSYEAQLAETQAEVDAWSLKPSGSGLATLPSWPRTIMGTVVLDNARAKLNRLYSLYARRYVSKPEVETAENEWAEADRKFETATVAFERRTAAGDSELRIAEARARAARARLRGLEAASRREPAAQARAQVREAEANLAPGGAVQPRLAEVKARSTGSLVGQGAPGREDLRAFSTADDRGDQPRPDPGRAEPGLSSTSDWTACPGHRGTPCPRRQPTSTVRASSRG